MTPHTSPNGVRVPGWFIAVVALCGSLIWAGYVVGQKVSDQLSYNAVIDYRLCRIEAALNIQPPWKGCAR